MLASLGQTATLPASLKAAEPRSAQPQSAEPQSAEAFGDFVGSVFYAEMLKALRSTQGEVAYVGGGKGEEMFRNQLDERFVDLLSKENNGAFAKGMTERFTNSLDVQI